MSDSKTFKRFPAVPCWITHIINGAYSDQERVLYTIFGQVKRVRIIATIRDKREILGEPTGESSFLDEDEVIPSRIELDLDDGTGILRAVLWREKIEEFKGFKKGDLVDIIGLINKYKKYKNISPEIITNIEDPNQKLLRDAQIIKRIKSGNTQAIPEVLEDSFDYEELDVSSLFTDEDEGEGEEVSIREQILSMIEEYSVGDEGVSFSDLSNSFNIPEEELKKHLKELEKENKIYPNNNVYTTYK
ncbi:MAG: hypothetical protein BAJALOKI1v1_280035 [Promethearchaeota archaeon]|nr:MAG: hypothetical protein BAJALOKI1v1_280035 [Candidatus Lokiarchaeota archaeon]